MAEQSLRLEVLDKVSALVTAAFGLVAALAWNDAIQTLFRDVFGAQSVLAAKAAYAVLVTAVAVVMVVYVGRAAGRAKQRAGKARA